MHARDMRAPVNVTDSSGMLRADIGFYIGTIASAVLGSPYKRFMSF